MNFSLNTQTLSCSYTGAYLSPWATELLRDLGLSPKGNQDVSYLAVAQAFGLEKFHLTTQLIAEVERRRPTKERKSSLIWKRFNKKCLSPLGQKPDKIDHSPKVEKFNIDPYSACLNMAWLSYEKFEKTEAINLNSWFWVEQALWERDKSQEKHLDLSYRQKVYDCFLETASSY